MAGVKGVASLKRMLRALPDAVRQELGGELTKIGERMLGRSRAEVPVKTGKLRAALNFTVAIKSLKLRLGLVTKATRRGRFYGYILDQGRAAKTVRIKRGPRAGAMMRISPIDRERYNFVFGRRADFQRNELPEMYKAVSRALEKQARKSGDD